MQFARHVPFIQHLGLRLEAFGGGEATVVLDLRPEHHNSHQMAHGGILLTLMDTCMANAGRAALRPNGGGAELGMITVELKTSFMQPARGQRIVARGKQFYEALQKLDDDKLEAGKLPRDEVEESMATLMKLAASRPPAASA